MREFSTIGSVTNQMESANQSSYDQVIYHSWPFAQSHPDRLAMVGTMFGMDPPPTRGDEFRVLELGCSCGDNLVPLAMQHPKAEFVGIDASQRQIEMARDVAIRLGVSNVRFEVMDILEFPDGGEPFDYISSHGVYSWVPPVVRDKLLAICRQHLKTNGIAYVSYNVYPGCRMTEVVRDVISYHVRGLPDSQERMQQGFAFLRFMAQSVPHENSAYTALYNSTLSILDEDEAAQTRLYHDLLESTNDPAYFSDFVAHADKHELQFLGEADIKEMQSLRFPPEVTSVLTQLGDDFIQREQYLDFFKHRSFRQTLLCHRDVTLQRQLRPERIKGLLLAADIQCDNPAGDLQSNEAFRFRDARGSAEASVDHPLAKAALLELREAYPQAMPFEELENAARRRLRPQSNVVQRSTEFAQESRELTEHLLQMYAAGLIEAHVYQPKLTVQVSERPVASSWARMQAQQAAKVTNQWYAGVDLSDVNRQLLLLLDGTRNRPQLLEDLAQQMEQQDLLIVHEGKAVQGSDEIRVALSQILDDALQAAAKLALLVE